MKTIEQYIETELSGKIARKRNTPLLALLVLAVGVGLLVLLGRVKMSDTLSATCLTVGLIATVVGLVLTAMNLSGAMTHFVYLPTHSRMCEKKVYLYIDDYRDYVEAINNDELRKLACMHPVVSYNPEVRLLASSDGECVLVQAVRDQNGHIETETGVRVITGPMAAELLHMTK
jgi:hypothetical protein